MAIKLTTIKGKAVLTDNDIQPGDTVLIHWHGRYMRCLYLGTHISTNDTAIFQSLEDDYTILMTAQTYVKRAAIGMPVVVGWQDANGRIWAVDTPYLVNQ